MPERNLQILHVEQDPDLNYLVSLILRLDNIPNDMDYSSTVPDALTQLGQVGDDKPAASYDVVLLGDTDPDTKVQQQNTFTVIDRIKELDLMPLIIGVAQEPISHTLIKATVPRGNYKDLVPLLRPLKFRR